ncbi:MAG: O-antigen ligase family protein [Leptolyngbyaceae cyanobacterium]
MKEPTKPTMEPSDQGLRRCQKLLRLSLATLPYGFYLNLVGILAVLGMMQRQGRYRCLDPLTRFCLIGISLGMVLSVLTAIDRGEAALQLSHFLPFFWLFAQLPVLVRSPDYQANLARDLVLSSVPINGIAIAEYAAKNSLLPPFFSQFGFVQAWQAAPHIGRAMVMFDHPNTLANYLTICLGVGLGLIIQSLHQTKGRSHSLPPSPTPPPLWLWFAVFFNLVGIFCSGSRNGILVAIAQLIGLAFMVKWNRIVLLIGGICGTGLAVAIALMGLGERTIGITQVMDDPRVGVWKIALDLITERPWLGWGPGSFKFLYPPRLVDPEYTTIFHTHNLWLLLGAEYGLPVMLTLTTVIGFICYRGVRAMGERSLSSSITPEDVAPVASRELGNGGDRAIFGGYALAFGGSIGFSLLDVTLYDARINVINWVLLSVIYAWSLKPPN